MNNPTDPFDLQRFVDAQAGVYNQVLTELRSGRKHSHWMWFIFPQIDGLGSSLMAVKYAIKSEEEAKRYLNHPLLGKRLRECTQTVLAIEDQSASEIFGYPDDLKLKSCMTLFAGVAESGSMFEDVLEQYFQGEADSRTLTLLEILGEKGK